MITKQLIKTTKLTKQELRNITNLTQQAYQHDRFNIRLYWNILQDRQLPEFDDFLCYVEGKLVGYLALFVFKEDEAELNAVIHPKHRNQGIFSRLLEEAALELKRRNIPKCQLITHKSAELGIQLAKARGGKYDHSECEMRSIHKPKFENLPTLELRPATENEVFILAKIDSQCFHTEVEKIAMRLLKNMQEKHRKAWIASFDGVDIGKAHVRFDDENTAFIHDLGVLPEHRRKHFGMAMVVQLRELLKKQGFHTIALDVLADNTSAIHMYEKCGFELTAEHQFWAVKVENLL